MVSFAGGRHFVALILMKFNVLRDLKARRRIKWKSKNDVGNKTSICFLYFVLFFDVNKCNNKRISIVSGETDFVFMEGEASIPCALSSRSGNSSRLLLIIIHIDLKPRKP